MTILAFEIEQSKLTALQKICSQMQIELKKVTPAEYMQPLGVLTGIEGFPKNNQFYFGAPFAEEMLVLCGMTSQQTDMFLAAYRASGESPIALKAIVTPTNIFWTPVQLFQELQKEHSQLK